MKFNYPQHLLLDIKTSNVKYTNNYWLFQYVKTFNKENYFSTTLNFINNPTQYRFNNPFLAKTNTIQFVKNSGNQAFSTHSVDPALRSRKLLDAKKAFVGTFTQVDSRVRTKDFTAFNLYKHNYELESSSKINHLMSTSLTHLLFDINFLKKERLYTKLKYSRSPAYDIVSGGAAALLSAFIGFLISEKFGIELVDSGDFYIVWMYIVFIALACRPFLKISDVNQKNWSIFSVNHALDFFQTLFFFCSRSVLKYFYTFSSSLTSMWTQPTSLNLLLFLLICFLF